MEPEWNNAPENDDVSMLGLRPGQFNNQICMSLDNDIDCNRLCSQIARHISNYNNLNGINSGRILVIGIKETSLDDSYVPKLEYKHD